MKEIKNQLKGQLPSEFVDTIPNDMRVLSETAEKKELETFSKIETYDQMVEFLKNSTSTYHKICGEILKGTIDFPADEDFRNEVHHIFPCHLVKKEFLTVDSPIERSFNLISVSPAMNCILHFFRFLEFEQIQDFNTYAFLQRLVNPQKEKMSIVQLISKYVKNIDYLNRKLRDLRFETFSPYTKSLFSNPMYWTFENIYTEKNPIVIKPYTAKSFQELRNILFAKTPPEIREKKAKNLNSPRNIVNEANSFFKIS